MRWVVNNLSLFKELYAQELAVRSHALSKESAHYLSIRAVCKRLSIPCTPKALHDYLTRGTINQALEVIK